MVLSYIPNPLIRIATVKRHNFYGLSLDFVQNGKFHLPHITRNK